MILRHQRTRRLNDNGKDIFDNNNGKNTEEDRRIEGIWYKK